jgi:hypothetical protein
MAIGRSRSPKVGTGVLSTADTTPFFLQAETLQPFISEELMMETTPVFYKQRDGRRSVGYDARLLPLVAEVYLKLRDHCLASGRPIPHQYDGIINACDVLIRGLATVGILALIDEATGYQEVRDQMALRKILDQYLRKEFSAWAKRFPDDFYKEIFRLRGWVWRGMKVNRPQVVAHYTNDIVYERLALGVLEELESRNPADSRGRRRSKHHQWLTDDVGHPALAQHIYGVIGLMRSSDDWEDFKRRLDRAYPTRTDTKQLCLFDDDIA